MCKFQVLSGIFLLVIVFALADQSHSGRHGHHQHHHHDEHDHQEKVEENTKEQQGGGKLTLPNLKDCTNRIHHASYGKHGYFFSWENEITKNLTVAWLTGRNICRRHCMDLVSLETLEENDFIKQRMIKGATRFIWTSGRKCNFNGCDRPDLQPVIVKGWFWSGSGIRLGVEADEKHVEGEWSHTGGAGKRQPDNRELELTGENDEACLAVLNNYYKDGIAWHDIACYHKKPFVCEDSDELLKYMGL